MTQILPKLGDYDPQEMQKLLDDGVTRKEIASKLKVSIPSVRNFILKYNLNWRVTKGQQKSEIYKYDPKEIGDLLNKVPRHRLCKELWISIKGLENYIKLHQIQYTAPPKTRRRVIGYSKPKPKNIEEVHPKPKRIGVDNSVHVEVENPFELFKEQFEKRKKKRIIQELKDGYY